MSKESGDVNKLHKTMQERILHVLIENGDERRIAGVGHEIKNKIRRGLDFKFGLLYKFAVEYGVSIDYLLGRTDIDSLIGTVENAKEKP